RTQVDCELVYLAGVHEFRLFLRTPIACADNSFSQVLRKSVWPNIHYLGAEIGVHPPRNWRRVRLSLLLSLRDPGQRRGSSTPEHPDALPPRADRGGRVRGVWHHNIGDRPPSVPDSRGRTRNGPAIPNAGPWWRDCHLRSRKLLFRPNAENISHPGSAARASHLLPAIDWRPTGKVSPVSHRRIRWQRF